MEREFHPVSDSLQHEEGGGDADDRVVGVGEDVDVAHVRHAAHEDMVRDLETVSRVQGEPVQALDSVAHNQIAAGQGLEGHEDRRAKRDRELRQMLDLLDRLEWLNQEIDRLQRQIEANAERIEDLEGRLDTLDELESLVRRGELDPSYPEHARLLRRVGIDPDSVTDGNALDLIAGRLQEIGGEIDSLRAENDRLQDQVDRLVQERDQIEARIGNAEQVRDRIAAAQSPEEVAGIVAGTNVDAPALAARSADDPEVVQAVYDAMGLGIAERHQDDQMVEGVSTADFAEMLGGPPDVASVGGPAEAVYGEAFDGMAPPIADEFAAASAGRTGSDPEPDDAGPTVTDGRATPAIGQLGGSRPA